MSLVVLIKLLKMAVSKVGQLKPFMIEEKKDGPNNTVSEVTANKWQGCMLANIKKEANWLPLISLTWSPKNRQIGTSLVRMLLLIAAK